MKLLTDPTTGTQLRIITTGRESAGKRFEVEVSYPAQQGQVGQRAHFHTSFREQFEVLAGTATYLVTGQIREAKTGEKFEIPENTIHLNPWNAGSELLQLRQVVELDRPDVKTLEAFENFVETIFGLAADGKLKNGEPSFLQGLVLAHSLQPSSYAAGTPVSVQRSLFALLAQVGHVFGYQARYAEYASPEPKSQQSASYEYHFFDRWYIPAPREIVWKTITQTESYTTWWGMVYDHTKKLTDGLPSGVGAKHEVAVHGPLPYKLRFVVEAIKIEDPSLLEVRALGDLNGRGIWRLCAVEGGTEVSYDWRPSASFPLIRTLSPVLKPLFRWNHDWCMQQGEKGLIRYLTETKQLTPTSEPLPKANGTGI
jgi:mannose-6-phosphate isomerase-like protein (cupin superfamily)